MIPKVKRVRLNHNGTHYSVTTTEGGVRFVPSSNVGVLETCRHGIVGKCAYCAECPKED